MNDTTIMISVLAWTCIVVFILTSGITLLALVKKISLPDESYLKKLFFLLILEVVGVGLFATKTKLFPSTANITDKIIITSPSNVDLSYEDLEFLNVRGSFISTATAPTLSGYFQINDGRPIPLESIKIERNKVFTTNILYRPNQQEKIKIVLDLNSIDRDSVEFLIEP